MQSLLGMLAGVFFLGLILVSSPAHAQIDYGVDFMLSLTPARPVPGELVRVRATSALLDLQTGEIVWYVNGLERSRGGGQTSIELTAPSLGSETLIRAAFIEEGFERADAESIIRPIEIDLIWESDSYVPHFFRGRALPSAGTNIRVEAIPRFVRANGSMVPASDIIFTWKKDGYVVQSVSGRGRSKAVLESPPLFGDETISVEARTTDGLFVGEVSERIVSGEPVLSLYENHPIFGTLNHRAVGAQDEFSGEEISFTAIPYFADAKTERDESLTYEWRVDDNLIPNDPSRPNQLTINAARSSGEAEVGLSLSHKNNFFLQVANSWKVLLGSSSLDPFGGAPQL